MDLTMAASSLGFICSNSRSEERAGVQTCALPIYLAVAPLRAWHRPGERIRSRGLVQDGLDHGRVELGVHLQQQRNDASDQGVRGAGRAGTPVKAHAILYFVEAERGPIRIGVVGGEHAIAGGADIHADPPIISRPNARPQPELANIALAGV